MLKVKSSKTYRKYQASFIVVIVNLFPFCSL